MEDRYWVRDYPGTWMVGSGSCEMWSSLRGYTRSAATPTMWGNKLTVSREVSTYQSTKAERGGNA